MKRFLALFMALAMVLTFVGCGKNEEKNSDKTKDEETKAEAVEIVGTWTMDCSYAKMMTTAVGIENEFESDVTLKMEWIFSEDGKLTIHNATDYAALDEKTVRSFSAELADYMLEVSIAEQGLTLEEYAEALKETGTTLDAVRTELYNQFVASFSGSADASELDVESTYKYKDGKVTLDDGSSFSIAVDGDVAELSEVEGDNVGILFDGARLTKKAK